MRWPIDKTLSPKDSVYKICIISDYNILALVDSSGNWQTLTLLAEVSLNWFFFILRGETCYLESIN